VRQKTATRSRLIESGAGRRGCRGVRRLRQGVPWGVGTNLPSKTFFFFFLSGKREKTQKKVKRKSE
jgi:hypothetical protein